MQARREQAQQQATRAKKPPEPRSHKAAETSPPEPGGYSILGVPPSRRSADPDAKIQKHFQTLTQTFERTFRLLWNLEPNFNKYFETFVETAPNNLFFKSTNIKIKTFLNFNQTFERTWKRLGAF